MEAFMMPYYQRVCTPLKQSGARLFSQDSDGNMRTVIDAFLHAVVHCKCPSEPHTGMDLVKLRRKYGNKAAFKGSIDKLALMGDEQSIRKKLENKMGPEIAVCVDGILTK